MKKPRNGIAGFEVDTKAAKIYIISCTTGFFTIAIASHFCVRIHNSTL